MVKYLIFEGADVNAKDKDNMTPIHYAARSENVEVVKYLISKGLDVNAKNDYDSTPLHLAVHRGGKFDIEMIKYLVSEGADVNARNSYGKTPLHIAAYAGVYSDNEKENKVVKFVEYLISEGADVNAKDNYGNTPLDIAKKCQEDKWEDAGEDTTILDFLSRVSAASSYKTNLGKFTASDEQDDIHLFCAECGTDVKATDGDGKTLLHTAAECGNLPVVKFFVLEGADVNAKDNDGKTPFDLAKDKENAEVVEYLESVGAKLGNE